MDKFVWQKTQSCKIQIQNWELKKRRDYIIVIIIIIVIIKISG